MITNVEILKAEDYKRVAEEAKQDYYEQVVENLIRRKYSVSAELAILRQRDSKQSEFTAYNAYAEECKRKAKEILNLNKIKNF